ncbi:Protein MGR2 [Smittium culicis]|uniref:Protein MGR2 n=1 Tax=Smittium culicis TaxID=133412 RepID=A0A1R1YCN5_9FUNG|nr:Protein MGR2 [Smittium culicis]OMJ24668.1 Protein MGR2 [Smittium culicis]
MNEPSVFDKLKMGFMMGGTVGACLGTLIGIYSTMKVGPGPRGYLASIGKYALGSGATFGFFMSIGSVIRTESLNGLPEHQLVSLQSMSNRNIYYPKSYASLLRNSHVKQE